MNSSKIQVGAKVVFNKRKDAAVFSVEEVDGFLVKVRDVSVANGALQTVDISMIAKVIQ